MLRPVRILLVDDNRLILRVVALVLEEVGFEVVPADSGEAALALARLDPPDLCIVDQEMPGMKGSELIRALRSSGDVRLELAPVLGISAYASAEAPLRAAGASVFLRKPIEEEALLDAVLAALAPDVAEQGALLA
jgi:CheY-like chemotaxis protein